MKEYFSSLQTDREPLPERVGYVRSIENFLERSYANAERKREEFTRSVSREERRKEYIKMQGFPLTEYEKLRDENIFFEKKYFGSNEYADYYRTVMETCFGIRQYGMLFFPKDFDPKRRYPLVIFNHGAIDGPEMAGSLIGNSFNYNHCGIRFVERGCVVYAPQMLTWDPNQYGVPYDRMQIDIGLRQLGGSFTALEMLGMRRTIDFFVTQNYVDETRIGYAGLSWGGMYALHMGAVEPRIKAVLCSCFFNDRRKINWLDFSYKSQADHFFDAEVGTLIFPRFLAIECGKKDELFKIEDAEREWLRLKKYARQERLEDRIFFQEFDGGHEFNPSDATMDWYIEKLFNGMNR